VFLEDLMAANLDLLFPGLEVVAAHPFRVTRDAEIEISLDQASDLLTAVEESIESRRLGSPIRFEVDTAMPDSLVSLFTSYLGMDASMVYPFNGPLGLADLWQLLDVDRPDLKDVPFLAYTPSPLGEDRDMFAAIRRQDYVLYHPYDSFNVTVNFLRQAAADPDVLAIKITLYRIDRKSPIIDALLTAKQNGKAVAALVELKAKFDEENNIIWARALEEAGVHVVYGLVELKVHSKVLLVVRREGERITHYCHLSSGNYNAVTSRVYGDIACFTADPEIGVDVARLFNALTGYAQNTTYKHLLVAPAHLRTEIIARVDREIAQHEKHGSGYLAFKLNGLLDKYVIQALYRASMAGVRVDLNVRGLCGLRPGVPGVSDNIIVTSIVGRFLEHGRIYYFRNGGDEEVLMGSADMMPRNLKNRVEILFPVHDARLRRAIIEHMLAVHLGDTVKARKLRSDGTYEPVQPEKGREPLDSQQWLVEHRGIWHALDEPVEIEYV
ncbi:MAG: polyphosphate kinase 1, partial [Deltaproteobacteria bacterium]|nr:polyphosphate kinase 1 [Candidatus Anaeroferrophillacea bacterium]